MLSYITKRILFALLTLLGVSMLTFALGRLAPGDPVDTVLAGVLNPSLEEIELAREFLQLDRPIYIQYLSWMSRVLRGDFGNSLLTRRPVLHELGIRFSATLSLMAGSAFVMVAVGISFGIISALNQNKPVDLIIRTFNSIAISVPAFCIGLLSLLFFAVRLGWLPVLPVGDIRSLILPSLTIGLGAGAGLARLTRSQIINARQKEHVSAALSFGVSKRNAFINNVLKNAAPPIITNIGLFVGAMLGGSAIIEMIFVWQGAGSFAVGAIFGRDYPVIQAYALIMAAIFITVNLLTDTINAILAPPNNILGVSADE